MRTKLLHLLLAVALLLVSATPAFAQETPDTPDVPEQPTAEEVFGANAFFLPLLLGENPPKSVVAGVDADDVGAAMTRPPVAVDAALALESPQQAADRQAKLDPALRGATGRQRIVVRMTRASATEAFAAQNANAAQQQAASVAAGKQQDELIAWVLSKDPSATVAARLTVALNAVVFEVDSATIDSIVGRPGVAAVSAVSDYTLDLSETVPHIGAAAVQAAGVDGSGVVVAVLDSGIDYHHRNLGGSGDVADYTANDPTIIEPGSFPTAKVVSGWDFVGASWPNTAEIPDPDPLDDGPEGGHGTHVADIIAGASLDGTHKGVAPGASLMAVKVCSSVSTSCSGVALLQGVEYTLDPNGDGNIADAVDVINMSLGSSYGQKEDDLSLASANAVRAGVVVVASAGNSADRPYIAGSPSVQPELISVAQTTVPSDKLFQISVNGTVVPNVGMLWQAWSAEPVLTSGVLQYGNGAGGNLNGCAAFPAGSLAGLTVLVDRGVCAISIKVSNAAAGGAVAAIVANNASQGPGEPPPSFSFGGGDPSIPGYTVTREDGALLKTLVGGVAVIDPASAVLIPNTMVASSSRGPSYSFNTIKPDIGAPGASLSAEYGTGDGETAFGGTSGAAPMVAGAAALVLDAYPGLSPAEVKARLMNTGDTDVFINPVALPGVLAPITRIGGGEVRVDDALATTTAAWDTEAKAGSLSFGYQAVAWDRTFYRWLTIKNYAATKQSYTLTPTFRYADDAASGAVSAQVFPSKVTVWPGRTTRVLVKLTVDADKLPEWGLNGGALGGDGFRLQSVEFDGYLKVTSAADDIHVAWQILPRKSAHTIAWSQKVKFGHATKQVIALINAGVATGEADIFALLGESPRIPKGDLPMPGDNFAVVDLRAVGARAVDIGGGAAGLQIGLTTFGERAHPAYPAEFDVYLDTNLDGVDDFVLYTAEATGFAATGQTLVFVVNLATGAGAAYFYLDADLNSANAILTAPMSVLGITPGTQIGMSVYAFDNYFTGFLTDSIEGIVFTPGVPRYFAEVGDSVSINPHDFELVKPKQDPAGAAASPSQTGFLFLYRNQAPGFEADVVLVK